MREALLALVLIVAGALVVAGVSMLFVPAAYIVGGLLVAALGYLFLAEAG
ncbi:hypothetical protein L2K70_04770 [Nocardioides KLBMP 9356]|uniref:DUF3096 domain-containing protein n=1 Tax=Nocardioides potassii TaxID=2911371 RepID=A0ABS9H9Y8_9ACTN|nr:hypothetical protein [Nocardioides potassii]MCF6376908.1 hypothetical protein [Nocardioides potassii]